MTSLPPSIKRCFHNLCTNWGNPFLPDLRPALFLALAVFFPTSFLRITAQIIRWNLLNRPKLGRKLPDTLSLNEINDLIMAIDLSKPEGERNRAMLETLYGCGLRVSELIHLRISDLFFEEDFIKVTGKGNKQRFVPISPSQQKIYWYLQASGAGASEDPERK